jgi:signal transduction histidine kinase/ligand-binding sensor domain-containing protein
MARWQTNTSAHLLAGVLCLLMAWSDFSLAAVEDDAEPGYYRTEWTTKSGAPAYIASIAQSPEGFLWLASSTGLYRFDGVEFNRYDGQGNDGLPVGRVRALMVLNDGSLWLTVANREVLHLRDGHIVFREVLPDDLGPIDKFLWGPNKELLLLASNGLLELSGDRWIKRPGTEAINNARLDDALIAKDESLWLSTDAGLFFQPRTSSVFIKIAETLPGAGKLSQAPDGNVWHCAEKSGLKKFDENGKLLASNPNFPCHQLFIDSSGVAWVEGSLGAGASPIEEWQGMSKEQVKSDLILGLFGKEVTYSVFEDREGTIWLGCTDGLRKFRRTRFLQHPEEGGSGGIAPAKGGGLWMVSYNRGLIHLGARSQTYEEAGKAFTYIMRDRDQIVWVGSHNRDVLIRIDGRKMEEVPFPPGMEDVFVNGIAVQSDGTPWVYTNPSPSGALYHLRNGQWLKNDGVAGLPEGPPAALYVDSSDSAWVTYPGSRIYMIKNQRLRSFPNAPDLNLGTVRSISSFGNDVLFAGEGGIALWRNGAFHKLRVQGDTQVLGVATALQTRDGDLWVNQPNGLLRFPHDLLERSFTHGDPIGPEVFDYKDGRRGPPFPVAPHPTLAQTDEGELWIAAINLTRITPGVIERNQNRPSAGFRHVLIDGTSQMLADEKLQLSHNVRELVLGYMSSSIADPERGRFRYMLEGLDPDWRWGNPQREAIYNQLRPGNYKFRLMASNNDGIWGDERSLDIEVMPPFYQAKWFIALCALAGLALLAFLVRARTRWVADRVRVRLEARSHERERIARELHDTLLQGIQGLILQLHLVADDLPEKDPNRQRMEGALDRADRLMDEGRQRVNDLRLHVVGAGVGVSLQRQLMEEHVESECRIRVREWGRQRTLTPTVQIELLRIAHEAVSNALHHGRCQRIHVVVRYDPDALRLRVWDDGCGISDDSIAHRKPLHWGITGMQERAKGIGGQMRVGLGRSRGTVVDVVVPGITAYANHRRRRWRRAFWR